MKENFGVVLRVVAKLPTSGLGIVPVIAWLGQGTCPEPPPHPATMVCNTILLTSFINFWVLYLTSL